MKFGISGLALFVVAVVTLAFSQTAAIVAKYLLFTTLRLNGGAQPAFWMAYAPYLPIVISAVLMAAALYVILARAYSVQDKNWAYGTLGTLVGFWLRYYG